MSSPSLSPPPRPSRPRHDTTPPPIMALSSNEFSDMFLYSDLLERLHDAFRNDPIPTIALRHYSFMVTTIYRLEQEIEHQRREQQEIFGHLIHKQVFRDRITPLVASY